MITELEWHEIEKFVTPPIVRKLRKLQAENVALRAKVLRLVMARGRDPEVQP